MANGLIISNIKNKIIKNLISDEDFVKAIEPFDIKNTEDLIDKYIFTYNQNPYTIKHSGTFITIQVHLPDEYEIRNTVFVKPTVEIWIISHFQHLKVTNIPKVRDNRNDYISYLLDEKLNGADYGIGTLKLKSNIEGSYQEDYLFRKMTFVTKDLNNSLCD